VSNDKYPLNTHLVVETTNYVYFVDSADQTKIYKVAVASGTCTQVDIDPSDSSGDNKSRDQDIQALWFDGTYIWGVDCDNDGATADFDVWKLAIADDTCTEIGTSAGATADQYAWDIFKSDGNMYVYCSENRGIGLEWLVIWDVDSAPFGETCTKTFVNGGLIDHNRGCMVGDDAYWMCDIDGLDETGFIQFDESDPSLNVLEVVDDVALPTENQQGMAYDGDDTIYLIMNYDADSKDYLLSYGITGNAFTKLDLYDICLMQDRFTDSTDDAPFNLEKGFHVSSRYIYQIPPKNMGKLRKIDDLTTLGVDGSIVAITDTYMFLKRDDTSIELWQYEDIGNEIHNCDIDYEMGMVTLAEFTTTRDFGSNVTANIYDDSAGLLFSGTIYSKKYDGLVREYKCVSYDKEMNDLKLSYDATAGVALNVAIEAILDNCGYLYYDSSITANATEIKADWNNIPVKEMLDTIAALAEWVWYVDTDGKVYFNDGTTDTGHTITNATGEVFSQVVIKDIQAQINYVKLYGGYVDGVRKTATAEDEASQQLHGLVKYIDHYPHITDQTQLDTLAAAILARADISSNPKYVYVSLYSLEKEVCGERINFAFSPLSLSADDFTILKIKYDATGDVGVYTLSSGFVSEEVVYGASSGVKTQPADEEQMDILGASVSGGGIENVVEDETPELGGDLDCNDKALTEIKSIVFQDGGSTVDIIRDEDNMATDDDAALATQQSIKAYADTKATAAESVAAAEAAGLTLAASKAIHIDGTPADDTYTGIVLDIDTTGCAVGDAVYVDGTNSVLPADADAIATMPAIGICVAAGKVLTHGVYRDDSVLALATASKVYVSCTAGDLTTTAPSGNGDVVQVMGITVGADMIFVSPSLDWVEVVV